MLLSCPHHLLLPLNHWSLYCNPCVVLMQLNPRLCYCLGYYCKIHLIPRKLQFDGYLYFIPLYLLRLYLLWAELLHFTHLSLRLHFMSYCPWWVSLVSIKTWDIGQKWVVFHFFWLFNPFIVSSYIGSYIHSSLWISFTVYKDTKRCNPYSVDYFNDIPGMLWQPILFCSCVYHGVKSK